MLSYRKGVHTAVAATVLAGLLAVAHPAEAGGGVSPGAAVGIGLGAFALGAATASAPYYGGYGPYYGAPYAAPYGYYPPPAPYYYAPRSCWNPYYRSYYAC